MKRNYIITTNKGNKELVFEAEDVFEAIKMFLADPKFSWCDPGTHAAVRVEKTGEIILFNHEKKIIDENGNLINDYVRR